jgi:hypothetical protein
MSVYFFRSEPGAAELRRLARRESGRVCQRVLMIANMLEGMDQTRCREIRALRRALLETAGQALSINRRSRASMGVSPK